MRLLDTAIKLARTGNGNRNYYLACVIKRADGAIVASCNELTRTPHPRAHAEAKALLKADLGAVLYVARVTRRGLWGMARPCKHCQAIIRNRGVSKVYYTIGPNEYGTWLPQKHKVP